MGRESQHELMLKHLPRFVVAELFRASLIAYILALFAESLYPGMVSYYFDMNIVLGFAVVFGLLSALFPELAAPSVRVGRRRFSAALWACFLSLAGAVYAYTLLKTLGGVAFGAALLAGILTGLLTWLVLVEDDEQEDQKSN